ncbi:MAG: ATP-binding protein [Thermodesulfobacteriota bacterium]
MSEKEIAEVIDEPERQIAHIRITPEKSHIKALIDMVTGIAVSNGMQTSAAERLDKVLADILENIVTHGFEGDTRKTVEVIIYRRLHSLVIAVEDKGLPFDYDKLEMGEEKRFKSYMSRHYADEVRFKSLGKGGNRTEIVKNLPSVDVREVMDIADHHEHVKLPKPPRRKGGRRYARHKRRSRAREASVQVLRLHLRQRLHVRAGADRVTSKERAHAVLRGV